MEIKVFGVVGAGQMGNGIAQVAAQSGLDVIMYDISDEACRKGLSVIEKNFSKSVSKGKITEDQKNQYMAKIKVSSDLSSLSNADFAVEAAVEREDLKFRVFKDLDEICRKEIILATNTSSIPIGRIASQTKRPEKIIGMHFMNPVPVMKLVEVIRGLATDQDTFDTTIALIEKFGKTPAESSDFPGFIANRILIPMLNEAVFALYHGVGTKEAIDSAMILGMNHPMGPLALADLIGLDTCLAIMETLYKGFGDSKYRPCPLLRKYVEAGWLGRKTGRGFYEYN
jgi:3-hydroxybutyryl-CoA dehydrogenase